VIVWRDDGWRIEPREATVLVDDVALTAPAPLRHGCAITDSDLRGWRLRFLVGDRTRALTELRYFEETVDPLSGLFNRRVMYAALERMTSGVLLFVDIDRLKQLNDYYGMLAGDTAIKRTASILRAHIAWPNFVARYGGEEFVIGMPKASLDAARALAEQIRRACEPPFPFETELVTATVSIGLALQTSGAAAIDDSEEAMRQAKLDGRNRVEG
jgi:diguanylate cyclase (GGDEF)-like protein